MPAKVKFDDEQELLNLKAEIEESKTKVSELTGQKNALMKQLRDDWGCKTIEEAEAKLKKMKRELDQLDTQINEQTKELEEKYNGNE